MRDGRFAQEWSREYNGDYPRLRQLLKQRKAMELWALERETIDALKPPEDT